MWLGKSENDPPQICDTQRCPSPPLEGGESLCDFYLPIDKNDFVDQLQSLQIKDGSKADYDFPNAYVQSAGPFRGVEGSGESTIFSLFGPGQLLTANSFTHTFLQSILSSVESRDPVVASAWMETLLDVIDLLPKEILKRDILTLAVSKGQLSQPLSSRLLCCKILGKICTKFEPYIIRKEVVPLVQSLCQDTEYEVRGEMCRQLDAVARGIGLEATRSAILPELVELAYDQEETVQLISVETVVRMLPMLDDETCNQTIIPLLKKLCKTFLRSKSVPLPGIAHQLGPFCVGLSPRLANEHRHWFLEIFQLFCKVGKDCELNQQDSLEGRESFLGVPDVVPKPVSSSERDSMCRQACAYNFPAIVLFAKPRCFHDELYETYLDLCNDENTSVRRTIASSFHEIAKILDGSNGVKTPRDANGNCHILLSVLNILMRDPKTEVIEGLLPNLTQSLEIVTRGLEGNEGHEAQLADLIHSLVVCEVTTAHASNWRLHADFLTCLSCLPKCLNSHKVQPSFLPLLIHKMHTARPLPCRLAAAYSLLVFLRYTPQQNGRDEIVQSLLTEFCFGSSCHKRMLYLRACDLAMELFSKRFFKDNFYEPLLTLAGDRVPNIRLRLCTSLRKLKSLLLMPRDSELLQKLEACVKRLMIDETDRDVASAVRKSIQELDEIEVALDPVTARRSSCNLDIVVDMEDIQKEEEEKKLWSCDSNAIATTSNMVNQEIPSSKMVPRRGKIPTGKPRPFSTHSWERPKRRTESVEESNKSSTLPTRRKNLTASRLDDRSQRSLSLYLPSGASSKTDNSSKIPVSRSPQSPLLSRIPRGVPNFSPGSSPAVSPSTSRRRLVPPLTPPVFRSSRLSGKKEQPITTAIMTRSADTTSMQQSKIPMPKNSPRRQSFILDHS